MSGPSDHAARAPSEAQKWWLSHPDLRIAYERISSAAAIGLAESEYEAAIEAKRRELDGLADAFARAARKRALEERDAALARLSALHQQLAEEQRNHDITGGLVPIGRSAAYRRGFEAAREASARVAENYIRHEAERTPVAAAIRALAQESAP